MVYDKCNAFRSNVQSNKEIILLISILENSNHMFGWHTRQMWDYDTIFSHIACGVVSRPLRIVF